MMEWLAENWQNIALCVLAILIVVYGLMSGKAKEWLKYAVCVAEKELKGKTGQIKLRYVYDMFVEQFPAFATVVPFTVFSKWVDLAIVWMKEQIDKNVYIKALIEGTENDKSAD